jgi:hypothetical protein
MNTFIRVNELELRDPNYKKKYSFTVNDDYTHAILINTTMPELNIPKNNVVGIAFEPPAFLKINDNYKKYAKEHIGTYLIGSNDNLEGPFKNGFGYQWHSPYKDKLPLKNKKMSIMISDKLNAPGHKYRHMLVHEILKTHLDIDILGRGCKYYNNSDSRLKGQFTENEIVENYEYHICIENYVTNDYFSEKIMDPLLSNTVPIYLGCKNIDNYFGGMVIKLTGNIYTDMKIITKLAENSVANNIDIEKVEEVINIKNLIETYFTD